MRLFPNQFIIIVQVKIRICLEKIIKTKEFHLKNSFTNFSCSKCFPSCKNKNEGAENGKVGLANIKACSAKFDKIVIFFFRQIVQKRKSDRQTEYEVSSVLTSLFLHNYFAQHIFIAKTQGQILVNVGTVLISAMCWVRFLADKRQLLTSTDDIDFEQSHHQLLCDK